MRRVKEVIIVEGRYDKNTVAQAVDATIIETSGVRILSDGEKIALLRRLAEKRGIILLTDSDRGGFFIRGRLRGLLDVSGVKHAYIPDIEGKERRKASPSKEGKLGVEGMAPDVIIKALEQAGATFEDEADPPGGERRKPDECRLSPPRCAARISKADLYGAGLTGGADSAIKRRELQKRLGLPERLTANGLLDVLNILYLREEFLEMLR